MISPKYSDHLKNHLDDFGKGLQKQVSIKLTHLKTEMLMSVEISKTN